MANNITHIDGRKIIDYDDNFAQVAIPATNVETVVLSFRVKVGMAQEIARYAMAWDAAMDTFTHMHLYVDGRRVSRYDDTTVQLSAPESDADLPVPVEIGQSSLIEVKANSTIAGNATARVRVLYYSNEQGR